MADLYLPDGTRKYGYDPRAEAIVQDTMQEFSQLTTWRNTFAGHWEEIAELIWPQQRNTFFYQNFNWPGLKKTDRQVDATGMLALQRFMAILDSLLTPRNMMWHMLGPEADDLQNDRATKLWFEQTTKLLFKHRYAPIGNFPAQNQGVYQSLGAFGTGVMFVDKAVGGDGTLLPALRYKNLPLGEIFLRENHQGLIDGFIRWFKLTADQAYKQFGDKIPEGMKAALEQKSQMPFNFLHRVCPRSDYDPGDLGPRGKPFASYYVCIEGMCLLEEGGYNSFPIAASRYIQAPQEVYGRSPAMLVLPALKTLNAEKRTFLKQGHRAADPVLLTADDGIVDFSMRPGALNKGGVNSDGRLLVQALPTGNIQVTKEMMDEERALTNDAFLVSLFQILTESPAMTATEVIERVNEKGILLAPTVGRQQSEYLGPLIDREIDLLAEMNVLPPMPPQLAERKGAYQTEYTSPLSRQQHAQEAAGIMRTLESTLTVVNATQDPSPLDVFEFDTIIPEIARIQGVPESWMASLAAIATKRKARSDAAQQQAQIQALPAQAAMLKAQATVSKQGGQSAAAQGGAPTGLGAPPQ